MSATIDQQLTAAALALALGTRRPVAGLLHHSDRGVQYCAGDYRDELKRRGIAVTMSRRANCYENAPMESANSTLKVERVRDRHYDLDTLILTHVNGECMQIFLDEIANRHPEERLSMVLDGAGWHQSESLNCPPTLAC